LHLRRGVIHPNALKLREALQWQAVVARPGGDDDRPRVDDLAVLEADLMRVRMRRQANSFGTQLGAYAKLVRLQCCSSCQLLTRQSSWEAQVILDARSRSCLASERGMVRERRGLDKTLRCAVNGRVEFRRSTA